MFKVRSGFAIAFAVLLLAPAVAAAPRERTFPLLSVYQTGDHNAGAQNFDVTEDARGIIYFANEWGLLEFDGAWWHLYKLPHDAPVFCVAAAPDGKIMIGSDGDFGSVEIDSAGRVHYVSLAEKLPSAQREGGQTTQVLRTLDGIIFISETQVVRWDGKSVAVLKRLSRDAPVAHGFVIDGHAWISSKDGLERVDGNRIGPVRGGALFLNRQLRMLLPMGNGRYLANPREEGLVVFDHEKIVPLATAAAQRIAKERVADALVLPDGRFLIATRAGGIVILQRDGDIDQIIDTTVGLPPTDITSVQLTSDRSLWIGLDDGAARIDISSPVSIIDTRAGMRGSVEAIVRHRGTLYVGTTSGLFAIGTAQDANLTSETPVARKIGQKFLACWSLAAAGPDLLAGSESGVAIIPEKGEPVPIQTPFKFVGYTLTVSTRDPNLVYAGGDRGIVFLRRDPAGWSCAGSIEDVPLPVRAIIEDRDGTLWAGGGSGMARIELSRAGDPASAHIHRYGDGMVNLFSLAGRVVALMSPSLRLLALDPRTGRFVPDPILGQLGNDSEIAAAVEDAEGRIWLASNPVGVATRRADGRYSFDDRRLLGLPKLQVDAMLAEPDGIVWIGSERGLFRYDSSQPRRAFAPHPPLVRRLLANGKPQAIDRGVELGAKAARRIRIELASLSFDSGAQYQYRLSPSEEEWSAWSTEPVIEFTNIWEGNYELFVRTRRTDGTTAVLTFPLRVMPPWYRETWAWLLWIALAAGLIAGLWLLRTRTLRARAAMLERRVAEQTHELREAVDQIRVARDALSKKNEALEFANAQLQELSFDDALTGIANRRRLEQMLQVEWNHAQRGGGNLGLIMLDLDHFKLLNDRKGHQEGDESLKRVAKYLAGAMRRAGDLAARYGGEEFAIVLPETDVAGAVHYAEQLRAGVERLAIAHADAPGGILTASFGIASIRPRPGDRPADLIAAADRALYRAKAAGRNCVRVEEIERPSSSMTA